MVRTQTTSKKLRRNRVAVGALFVVALAVGVLLLPNKDNHFTARVEAASACPTSTPTGKSTLTTNVTVTGTYNVWSRIKVPATTNSYYLKIDNTCYKVVGSNLTANQWGWVNFENGSRSSSIKQSLQAGNHTITLIGNENGVKVDRLILTVGSCVPSGTGDACALPVDSPPTLTVDQPTEGQSVTSVAKVKVTAVDDTGISKVNFLVDDATTPIRSITSAPFSFDWDTSMLNSGQHKLTAVAYDTVNQTKSASVNVNVQEVIAPPPPPTAQVYIAVPATNDTVTGKEVLISSGTNGLTSVSKVDYTLDDSIGLGSGTPTKYGWIVKWDSTLTGNGNHKITAKATAGATSVTSAPITVNVQNSGDNSAPSTPGNLRLVRPPARTAATVTWNASTDNSGGTIRYYIYLNDTYKSRQQGLTRQFGNLTKGTTYTAKVVAVDETGNQSTPAVLVFRTKSFCITRGICVW